MTRRLRLSLLTLALSLSAAAPAAAGIADWISWIEELSGPGPFHGYTASVDRLVCWSEPLGGGPLERSSTIGAGRTDPCRAGRDAGERRVRAYLSVELGRYKSSRNVLAPQPESDEFQVGLTRTSVMVFGRLAPGLEAGAGLGFNRFSGDGLRESYSFTRVSVPLRVRVLPGMWVDPGSRFARAIHLNAGFDRLPSSFDAADFGQVGPFREEGESLASVYVGVDVLSLIR
jgi:hypothetical protein